MTRLRRRSCVHEASTDRLRPSQSSSRYARSEDGPNRATLRVVDGFGGVVNAGCRGNRRESVHTQGADGYVRRHATPADRIVLTVTGTSRCLVVQLNLKFPKACTSSGLMRFTRWPAPARLPCRAHRVFEVQHATPASGLSLGGRVNKKRTHGDDSACGRDAIHGLNVASQLCDLFIRHHAARVGSGKNTKRAVVCG